MAILNSKVYNRLNKLLFGDKTNRVSNIKKLPIPILSEEQQMKMERLVDEEQYDEIERMLEEIFQLGEKEWPNLPVFRLYINKKEAILFQDIVYIIRNNFVDFFKTYKKIIIIFWQPMDSRWTADEKQMEIAVGHVRYIIHKGIVADRKKQKNNYYFCKISAKYFGGLENMLYLCSTKINK